MSPWQALLDAAEAIRAKALAGEQSLVEAPLAGIGWASVDAERAQRELDALLVPDAESDPGRSDEGGWLEQPRDASLGARVWLRPAYPHVRDRSDGPWLVVLEPDTEGRLAASLARHDEGVAVIYLGTGPYRAGRLRDTGKTWGPLVIVLDGQGWDLA